MKSPIWTYPNLSFENHIMKEQHIKLTPLSTISKVKLENCLRNLTSTAMNIKL